MIGAMALKWEVRQGFGMMSRKDLAWLMRGWTRDAVFEFPGKTPISGRYEGKPAIEAFFRRVFDRMETIQFTVKRVVVARPFALGLTNTVLTEWAADQASHDGISVHLEGVTVSDVRRGRNVASREYVFDPALLERMWGHREAHEIALTAAGAAS